MCPLNFTVWFVCKSCNLYFAKVDDFIEHKKENHLTEFKAQNTSCIVFEERTEGDFDSESGSVETKPIMLKEEFQLVNESRIEIETHSNPNIVSSFDDQMLCWQIGDGTAQTSEYFEGDSEAISDILEPKTELVINESQNQEKNTSAVGLFQPQQNPYVLVKRLTSKEITDASGATNPKCILKKHLESHFVSRPFKCLIPNCGKAYVFQTSLITHKATSHSNARPYGCPKCHKAYKLHYRLVEHERSHTGERPFKCPVDNCNKTFAKANTLCQQKKVAHRIFNSVRTSPLLLKAEFQGPRTSKEIQTNDASSATNRNLNLNKHLKPHKVIGSFKCKQSNCGKEFKCRSHLNAHIRSHSDLRPFGCPQCNKTFKFHHYLVEHVRMHTGERPYKCPFENCGKTFAKSTTFCRHKKEYHNMK